MPSILAYQSMASSRARNSKVAASERPKEPDFQSGHQQAKASGRASIPPPKQMISAFHQLRSNPEQTLIVEITKSRPDLNAEKAHYQSSGSEHEPSSVCLAAMVNEFMEDQAAALGRNSASCKELLRSKDHEERSSNMGGELREILKGFIPCSSSIECDLLAEASKAVSFVKEQARQICREDGPDCTSGCLKRATMSRLREAGYNAAICKSRWDHGGGFPGGDYEYMDVLIENPDCKAERLIVDIDFRGQFEIARPTDRYSMIVQELPQIFVGKPERLQQIVNLMCDAVKQSLKKREMPLPPWRKPDYMRAKWFSAYKRTTNELINPHESSEVILSRELLHTAIRGSRWDSTRCFTKEIELQLGRTPATDRIKVVVDRSSSNSGTGSRSGNEITAMTTDWKPPAVVNCRKASRVAGLASVLIEAGLSTLAKEHQQRKQQVQEQQQQQQRKSESNCQNLVTVS